MKKLYIIVPAFAVALLVVGVFSYNNNVNFGEALAAGEPADFSWAGGGMGKVTFSHSKHIAKGKVCNDCHTAIVQMKKSPDGTHKMNDIYAGKACGACHKPEGPAFDAKTNCQKCHVK